MPQCDFRSTQNQSSHMCVRIAGALEASSLSDVPPIHTSLAIDSDEKMPAAARTVRWCCSVSSSKFGPFQCVLLSTKFFVDPVGHLCVVDHDLVQFYHGAQHTGYSVDHCPGGSNSKFQKGHVPDKPSQKSSYVNRPAGF